jgi:hypothetical protein
MSKAAQHSTTFAAPPMLQYAIGRIDRALTALGCVAKELVDCGDDTSEAASILYLYGVLREETLNLRNCVGMACHCHAVGGMRPMTVTRPAKRQAVADLADAHAAWNMALHAAVKAMRTLADLGGGVAGAEAAGIGVHHRRRGNALDAKLIRLCDEFIDVSARLAHIDERLAGDADEAEVEDLKAETEPLLLRHDRLLEPIAALNARTYLGRRMKASAAFAAMRTTEETESDDLYALIRSALRDVAELAQEVPS